MAMTTKQHFDGVQELRRAYTQGTNNRHEAFAVLLSFTGPVASF